MKNNMSAYQRMKIDPLIDPDIGGIRRVMAIIARGTNARRSIWEEEEESNVVPLVTPPARATRQARRLAA